MRAFLGSRISDHLAWTPEKFLICTGVVLCRTGTQDYRVDELFGDGDQRKISVHREAADVLAAEHIASLEGKPVTSSHPPMFLNATNAIAYAKGHVQNVRRGKLASGEDCLIGDLIITDKQLAEDVVSGKLREVSSGYDCEYTGDGEKIYQRSLRANHIAIVPAGRAGSSVRIMDHGGDMETEMSEKEAIAALSRIAVTLGLDKPRNDAERHAVLHAAQALDAEVATMLDEPSAVAQQYADETRKFHRGGRIGTPDVRVLQHDHRDCRASLRTRSAVADAKPQSPEQIAEEFAQACRSRFRQR